MSAEFTGGCACGAIRYKCNADPIVMFNCHCRDCQRASGRPYTAVVYFPAKALKIKGTPRYYDTPSETGGHNKRAFCPECGSRLSVASATRDAALPVQAWMIQACFVRSSTSSLQMRNRGMTWTRSCRSLKGTRRQTVDGYLDQYPALMTPRISLVRLTQTPLQPLCL